MPLLSLSPLPHSFAEAPASAGRVDYDLTRFRDDRRVLTNPHKGWYLHFYDNSLLRYGDRLEASDRLEDFPGLATIFLRLPWEVLEPVEGRFAWDVIDREVERWVPTGRTIAFCITCKETSYPHAFATPRWVAEAGAKGTLITQADETYRTWEPDYGDPIFLAKLRAFHTAFAARYDGQPWVEWVDIASYGDWGEGHTTASSHRDWPVETILAHIEIHTTCYRRSRLAINDDHVGSRHDGGSERLRAHIDRLGLALTDHGVCVDWFARHFGYSTLRDPAWLRAASERKPVVLELEHYQTTVQTGRWQGGRPLVAAVEEARASFVGFHGYAREWLAENPVLAAELANTVGYWLFIHAASLDTTLGSGSRAVLELRVENRGVAPLYHPAELRLRLVAADGHATGVPLPTVDPRRWAPRESRKEVCRFTVPEGLAAGRYRLELGLFDTATGRVIELALTEKLRSAPGYYLIGETVVTSCPDDPLNAPTR